MSTPTLARPEWIGAKATVLAVTLLLGAFGGMAASVSDQHSTTADEIFHVTAGYSYWVNGDFRLHPENGNFPQRWAALPLIWQRPKFPATNQPAWTNADAAEIGFQFFYEKGNDLARMLRSARMMTALLGIALGAVVFAWSRSLFGRVGGLVSVALFAFCPNLIAHAGLATSDTAACLGFVLAVLGAWRLLHRITIGRVLAAGGAYGLLALAKFSSVLIAPMLLLLILVRSLRGADFPVALGRYRARLRGLRALTAILVSQAVAVVIAGGIIWAAFGFRFRATAAAGTASHYNQPWTMFFPADPTAAAKTPLTMRLAKVALDFHVLPEPFLYGFIHTLHFARGRPAFFLGEYRTTGWPQFFPIAFLLKTPLPFLGLLATAVIVGWRGGARRSWHAYRLAPLAVLLAVYWAFALTSKLNIGHRHILVTYPALAIVAGAAALGFRQRWVAVASALFLLGQAATSWAIRPSYLAYFNPLLGGPDHAYRQMVDSSLDWGQDLPGLAQWLGANARGRKVFLSYFGSGHPPYYGIRATRLGDGFFDLRERTVLPEMSGGLYCISATMFQQPYTMVRHGWTPQHEARLRELAAWVDAWRSGRDRTDREAAISRMIELEHLRFGRLCAGLQGRQPDQMIGYSILVFALSDADVNQLLQGPPPFRS